MSSKQDKQDHYDRFYSDECCGAKDLGFQLDRVAVGLRPVALAVTRDGNSVYVVNQGSDSVSVIDVASLSVGATPSTGAHPMGIAMHPSTDVAYVANFGDRSVSVFDTTTHTTQAPIAVQSGSTQISPAALAVSGDGARLFVNSDRWAAAGGLAWIDLGGPTTNVIEPPSAFISSIAGVPFSRNPYGVAPTMLGTDQFFAAHRILFTPREIRLANTTTNSFASFQVDLLPCALLEREDTLIVTGYKSNATDAADLGIDIFRQSDMQRLQHIDVPGVSMQLTPGDLIPIEGFGMSLRPAALDPTCDHLWYGNPGRGLSIGHVGIYDLNAGQFRTFAVKDCNGIAFTPDGKYAFLSDTSNDQVIRVTVR